MWGYSTTSMYCTMYVCMYVCICMYVYVCMYMYMYVCRIFMYVGCMYVCMYIRMNVLTFVGRYSVLLYVCILREDVSISSHCSANHSCSFKLYCYRDQIDRSTHSTRSLTQAWSLDWTEGYCCTVSKQYYYTSWSGAATSRNSKPNSRKEKVEMWSNARALRYLNFILFFWILY